MYDDDVTYPVEPENVEIVSVDVTVAWSNQAIQDQVTKAITQQIHDTIADKVQQAVFNQLDDVVNSIILETMDKEVQRTDGWGKPIGDATSISELLMRDTETWLNASVDQYGHTGGRSYSRDQTRAQYLFKEATKDSLPKHVKDIVVKNIGDIDALIESEVKRQLRAKLK